MEYLDILPKGDILLGAISQNTIVNGPEKEVYFYHGDNLGSANWVTDGGGKPIQYIHYAPYGELLANQQAASYDERYKFIGKERDQESGYDNFGARYYADLFGIWTRPDPLLDKTIHLSSYMYCNGNPIVLKDPDGGIAIAASKITQTRLLSTLSCSERKYVRFDKNGMINVHRINRCKSTSHNMTALKALANSKDVTYNFYVRNSSTNGETAGEKMREAGGVTEMYGLDKDASPDPSIVNIISGDHLTGEDAAANMAHEAFGHAYMYELTGGDTKRSSHDYEVDVNKSYVGEDGSWNLVFIDKNMELQQHINEAVEEAKNNYNCGL